MATGYSQRAFADRLQIPLETYRPYDSARRLVPVTLLDRAAGILREHQLATQLFTIDYLAREYDIHPRTLRAAARDGRLQVEFSNRSVFGRPLRLATTVAVEAFIRVHFRQRYSRFAAPLAPVPVIAVPTNFASRIVGLRQRHQLTQGELARRIGAATKAVVYQWESGKRRPSVAFWSRILLVGSPESETRRVKHGRKRSVRPSGLR